MKFKNSTSKICHLGIGIALYVVLSMTLKIPIIGHIQTDLGYVAFGAYLGMFGTPGIIVGVIGCLLESLIFSGWVPIGWMVGQAVAGYLIVIFNMDWTDENKASHFLYYIFISYASLMIGISIVKTIIECGLYSIPLNVKFVKNFIAVAVDIIPMSVGLEMADILKENTQKQKGE